MLLAACCQQCPAGRAGGITEQHSATPRWSSHGAVSRQRKQGQPRDAPVGSQAPRTSGGCRINSGCRLAGSMADSSCAGGAARSTRHLFEAKHAEPRHASTSMRRTTCRSQGPRAERAGAAAAEGQRQAPAPRHQRRTSPSRPRSASSDSACRTAACQAGQSRVFATAPAGSPRWQRSMSCGWHTGVG